MNDPLCFSANQNIADLHNFRVYKMKYPKTKNSEFDIRSFEQTADFNEIWEILNSDIGA